MKNTQSSYERFIIAEAYFQRLILDPNDSLALGKLRAEAKEDNVWAIVKLAECYINELIPAIEDHEPQVLRAVEMLKELAERGFAFAQYKLARYYFSRSKKKKVINLLRECVKAQIPEAAIMLSELLEEKDPEEAVCFAELGKRWGAIEPIAKDKAYKDKESFLHCKGDNLHDLVKSYNESVRNKNGYYY
ncbi:hypothetical protein [Paenibacillus sp. FSL K6-2859]|jgi:TPR repeat protein|uniref:hypothetical protein n=1 Tax=Paenibacillus sp. FSL K6-2859 TaxID=2921482 RepID=UPI0030FC0D81